MATLIPPRKSSRFLVHEDDYPLWKASFSDELRDQLVDDDLLAGRSVSAVLITIVVGGLLLGIAAVLYCL